MKKFLAHARAGGVVLLIEEECGQCFPRSPQMILTLAELRIGGARLELELDGLLEQPASLRGLAADLPEARPGASCSGRAHPGIWVQSGYPPESLADLEPCLMRGSASAWRPDIIRYFPILSRMSAPYLADIWIKCKLRWQRIKELETLRVRH